MELLTQSNREALLRNGKLRKQSEGIAHLDFFPVVKLFTPDGGCTWLLTELDPDAPDIAFGLCDLGMGFPELGCVGISDLAALRGKLGIPVERDLQFCATKSISAYAAEARRFGWITV